MKKLICLTDLVIMVLLVGFLGFCCRAKMEAILNRSLFHLLFQISVIGRLTLLSWTFQTQILLGRFDFVYQNIVHTDCIEFRSWEYKPGLVLHWFQVVRLICHGSLGKISLFSNHFLGQLYLMINMD